MADTPPTTTPPADPPKDPPAAPPTSTNGDTDPDIEAVIAGAQHPDAVRRLLNRSSTEAAHFRHELRQRETELADLRRQHETEQERRDREAYERGRVEAGKEHETVVADYERQLATLAIRARAADSFADADDAVAQLAHSGTLTELLAIKDDGQRSKAVETALKALLESKPYLARATGSKAPLVTPGGRSSQPDRPRERSWLRG